MTSHQRISSFSRFMATHRLAAKADRETLPDQGIGRSAEVIVEELKQTLTVLLEIPAQERTQHYSGFQALCAELEKATTPFPLEMKTKIDSLLWFCERICRPDFVPSDGQSSFLAWPHTLLDAIKERLQEESPNPDD